MSAACMEKAMQPKFYEYSQDVLNFPLQVDKMIQRLPASFTWRSATGDDKERIWRSKPAFMFPFSGECYDQDSFRTELKAAVVAALPEIDVVTINGHSLRKSAEQSLIAANVAPEVRRATFGRADSETATIAYDETDMQTQLENQRLARHADFILPSRQLQSIAHGGIAQGGIVLQRTEGSFNVKPDSGIPTTIDTTAAAPERAVAVDEDREMTSTSLDVSTGHGVAPNQAVSDAALDASANEVAHTLALTLSQPTTQPDAGTAQVSTAALSPPAKEPSGPGSPEPAATSQKGIANAEWSPLSTVRLSRASARPATPRFGSPASELQASVPLGEQDVTAPQSSSLTMHNKAGRSSPLPSPPEGAKVGLSSPPPVEQSLSEQPQPPDPTTCGPSLRSRSASIESFVLTHLSATQRQQMCRMLHNAGLRIAQSTIINAGVGLFAAKNLEPDLFTDKLYYTGEEFTEAQWTSHLQSVAQSRPLVPGFGAVLATRNPYAIKLTGGHTIDAHNEPCVLARYVQHSRVNVSAQLVQADGVNDPPVLMLLRSIYAGEEIFIDYIARGTGIKRKTTVMSRSTAKKRCLAAFKAPAKLS